MVLSSDSFRYVKKRKGGRVRSFGGLCDYQSTKKASSVFSKNMCNFFLASSSCQMKHDTCEQFWLPCT